MRREGYARALIEANLPVDPDLYGEVTFVDYEKNVFKTLDQIFSKVPDVDGFFFTTHILALEAFRYFYEKGININKGYELACIHGVSAFRVLAPNMNIARMPIEEIIDEIAKTNDVELIDATQTVEKDLSEYDLIGFASGVYGGKFHQSVLKFASVNLTDNKNVFLICTYGGRPMYMV